MLIKIDDCFLAIAKKMIEAAAFFGITRRQLIYWHITISSIMMYVWPAKTDVIPFYIGALIAVVLGVVVAHSLFLPRAIGCYREDDKLGNDLSLRYRSIRVQSILLFYGVSLFLFPLIYRHHPLQPFFPVIAAKILLPAYFWPYLILNQNTGKKQTAKNMTKAWLASLKDKATILRPEPKPQPAPVQSFIELSPPPAGAFLVQRSFSRSCKK